MFHYLGSLVSAILFASVTLGFYSVSPSRVGPVFGGALVATVYLAVAIKSIFERYSDPSMPDWYRRALQVHGWIALLGSLGLLILLLVMAPARLAALGASIVGIIEWLYSIPVIGWIVKILAGLLLLHYLHSVLRLFGTVVFGTVSAVRNKN